MSGARGRPPRIAAVLVALLAAAVLLGAVAPLASAGDGATILQFEHEGGEADGLEVDPGEPVTLDLVVYDHGDLQGNGVSDLALTLAYDDPLTVESVDHHEWLSPGSGPLETDVDHDSDARTIEIDERLPEADEGVVGNEPVATLTVSVPEDASPANAELRIAEADVRLVSDWPQSVFDRNATLLVDGGVETDDDPDAPDGVTLGDDADLSDDGTPDPAEDGDGESDVDDADGIPGLGVLAGVVAVIGLAVAVATRRT